MYDGYISSLNRRGYDVYDYIECRSCTLFILKKSGGRSSQKYVLKLFTGSTPDGETYRSWYSAYKIRSERLGDYSYEEARIPHVLEFWEKEQYGGFGETFGLLADYISGRTLSEMLYNILDNDDDRRRLLLRVMPDYIDALEFGNKADYYHLDIDEDNLLADSRSRGWVIDYTGAFICGDYLSGRQPEGGYMHCFSDRIAPVPSKSGEFAEKAKADAGMCEHLQAIMLIRLMEGFFDRGMLKELARKCSARQQSPLETLRSGLKIFE